MPNKQVVPDFPAPVYLFTGANAIQLAQNPRVMTHGQFVIPFVANTGFANDEYPSRVPSLLLLPKGTDVRGTQGTATCDWIQIPALTGNWYICYDVGGRWLGYPGEHIFTMVWGSHQLTPHDSPVTLPCTVPAIPATFRTPFKN